MAKRGFDLSSHQSRRLEDRHVATADLIVGMTREHVREAVVLDPTAWSRAFTLKELVRRARRRPRGDEPLDQWLAALASDREAEDLLGTSEADDVADPIGLDRHAYEETADELDRLTAALVALAWP